MKKPLLCLAVAALLAASTAFGASEKGFDSHFGDMDKNKDSAVTWEEFKGFFPHAEQDNFKEADADNNGKIDHNEWHAFKDKHGYGHAPKKK
jgi:hypothetical protein